MNELLVRCLAIGLAGSVGSLLRYGVAFAFGRINIRFPIGTLFINISGSLFLGWFYTHVATRNVSDTTKLAIGVGFVGAYTTFSTYMYESYRLINDGAILEGLTYLLGSLALGLIAVRVGVELGRLV
jgi:CrcB protein